MRCQYLATSLLAVFLFHVPNAEAQSAPAPTALASATVHVLDPSGAPVSGAEVELAVTRADGSSDRRLGTSSADGTAVFDDVRADCTTVAAVVRLGAARIEGSPRPCSERIEVFVVVASPPKEATIAPAPVEESPVPSTPWPAAPAPAPAPSVDWSSHPLNVGLGLGVDVCQDWMANKDASCGQGGTGMAVSGLARFRLVRAERFALWSGLEVAYRGFAGEPPKPDAESSGPTLGKWQAHAVAVGLVAAPGFDVGRFHARLALTPLGYLHRVMRFAVTDSAGELTQETVDKTNDMYLAGALELSISLTPRFQLGAFSEVLQPLGVGANVKRASGLASFGLFAGMGLL